MYDYMLGGTHNFQIDRDATEQFSAQMPDLEDAAWANRGCSTAGSPAARDLRGVPFPPVSTGSPMCRHALVPERFRGKVPGYLAPGRLNVPTG